MINAEPVVRNIREILKYVGRKGVDEKRENFDSPLNEPNLNVIKDKFRQSYCCSKFWPSCCVSSTIIYYIDIRFDKSTNRDLVFDYWQWANFKIDYRGGRVAKEYYKSADRYTLSFSAFSEINFDKIVERFAYLSRKETMSKYLQERAKLSQELGVEEKKADEHTALVADKKTPLLIQAEPKSDSHYVDNDDGNSPYSCCSLFCRCFLGC